MGSYLSHLVERALGSTEGLQPAASNPFEPAPLAETAIEGPASPGADVERRARLPQERTLPPAQVDLSTERHEPCPEPASRVFDAVIEQAVATRAPAAAPMPRHAEVESDHPELPRREIPEPLGGMDALDAQPMEMANPPAVAAQRISARRHIPLRRAQTERMSPEPITPLPAPVRSALERAAQRRVLAGVEPAAEPHADGSAPRRRDATADSQPGSTDSAQAGTGIANVQMRAKLAPLVRAHPPAPPAGAQMASAPDVHITIGRVEIRAHTAPARAKPPPAKTPGALRPSLSLSDYLSRRGKGRA
jgi:hypothetical protein